MPWGRMSWASWPERDFHPVSTSPSFLEKVMKHLLCPFWVTFSAQADWSLRNAAAVLDCTSRHTHTHTHTERERERERESHLASVQQLPSPDDGFRAGLVLLAGHTTHSRTRPIDSCLLLIPIPSSHMSLASEPPVTRIDEVRIRSLVLMSNRTWSIVWRPVQCPVAHQHGCVRPVGNQAARQPYDWKPFLRRRMYAYCCLFRFSAQVTALLCFLVFRSISWTELQNHTFRSSIMETISPALSVVKLFLVSAIRTSILIRDIIMIFPMENLLFKELHRLISSHTVFSPSRLHLFGR